MPSAYLGSLFTRLKLLPRDSKLLLLLVTASFIIICLNRFGPLTADPAPEALSDQITETDSASEVVNFEQTDIATTDLDTTPNYITPKTIEAAQNSTPEQTNIAYTVKKGDIMQQILAKHEFNGDQQHAIIRAVSKVYNLRRLSAGTAINFEYLPVSSGQDQTELSIDKIIIKHDLDKYIEIIRDGEKFAAKIVGMSLTRKLEYASALIEDSLYNAATNEQIPSSILHNLVSMFSYDIDFERDIKAGDRFSIIYEQLYNDDGQKIKDGKILFATINTSKQKYSLYGYNYEPGKFAYFDNSGNIAKKALLRTPVNAPLSSKFGMRRHPVLGYNVMHKGVDFAAPVGTPVYAAGNGVIARMGRYGSYGRYIKITHGNGYATAYAHLSRYGKKLHVGSKVKQGDVIGYTGRSGCVTGPHLHYEVLINGKHVNPLKIKLAPTLKLSEAKLKDFKKHVGDINQIVSKRDDREITVSLLNRLLDSTASL